MITEEDIVNRLTESVTERVTTVIQENFSNIVQQEISRALARALLDGEFYRSINSEVFENIENIYSEIREFKKSLTKDTSAESIELLGESDSILDNIVKTTENATLRILDYLEQMQQEIRMAKELLDSNDISLSKEKLNQLDKVILNIMTELSFQDLTGQQIKRVIQSLKKVEEMVFNVYVTSEILKKSKEKCPEEGVLEIRERARDLIHTAKAQKTVVDQDGVDKLLEKMGL